MISSRLTAWENLLDSVSHIGPLTNNPAEAKRLQVIRPDQNAPLAQKLSPESVQHLKGKSKKNQQKRRKNNINKQKRILQTYNQPKTRKGASLNDASRIQGFNHAKGVSYHEDKRRIKVRILLSFLNMDQRCNILFQKYFGSKLKSRFLFFYICRKKEISKPTSRKLSPEMGRHLKGKSKKNKQKRRKNNINKQNRRLETPNRPKTRKGASLNDAPRIQGFNHAEGFSYHEDKRRKVRILPLTFYAKTVFAKF